MRCVHWSENNEGGAAPGKGLTLKQGTDHINKGRSLQVHNAIKFSLFCWIYDSLYVSSWLFPDCVTVPLSVRSCQRSLRWEKECSHLTDTSRGRCDAEFASSYALNADIPSSKLCRNLCISQVQDLTNLSPPPARNGPGNGLKYPQDHTRLPHPSPHPPP